MRGVHPTLAAPMADTGEGLLGEAVAAAAAQGLVKPDACVVCILSQQRSLVVKIVQVDAAGTGIRKLEAQPTRLVEEARLRAANASISLAGGPARRTSISLVGAGALGADVAMAGGGLVATPLDLDEAAAKLAAALN